jgi:hypothetical protein
MFPPAWIPRLATTTARFDAAETLPPARIAKFETLLVNVRLFVTVRSPPVSSRRVLAVIAVSSVSVRDKVFGTSVPAVMARELVNGTNFTAPVPAFMEPVSFTLFDRTVTSVFVTERADRISSSPVDVDASYTKDAGPVEENEPVRKAAAAVVTAADLVLE